MSTHRGVRLLTLNLRHNADRWPERAPLLYRQFAALAPDVACVQEVHVPSRQGHALTAELNARIPDGPRYELYQVNKTGEAGEREGIAIITRLAVAEHESLDLRGGSRVAQRVRVVAAERPLDVWNTHLHHAADAGAMREAQAQLIVGAMGARGDVPAALLGDLNAQPHEPPVRVIAERMRSAYAAVHGAEPAGTVPTPLNAEWGQPAKVIDYIFVTPGVRVVNARLAFDELDEHDDRLCGSDHYGLVADLELRER